MGNEEFKFDFKKPDDPPEPQEQGPVPAGFNERFVAYVIDTLPFVLLAYLSLSYMVKSGILSYSSSTQNTWKALWIFAYIVYEAVLSSGGRATVGKYLMNIRVRAADGASNLSFAKAFVRAVSYLISALPLNVGYLAALFTPKKRALHDYLAGSRVVTIKERSDMTNGLVLAFSWVIMAALAGTWVNQNILTMGPDEQRQVAAARTTVSKIATLEEIHKMMHGRYTEDIKRLAALTGKPDAVRNEIIMNIEPNTLVIATNGREYIITAKAKTWRKTEVKFDSAAMKK